MVHTGTCQLKIIWNLIQENSEDNYEFSASAETYSAHTHTHWTLWFYGREKIQKGKRNATLVKFFLYHSFPYNNLSLAWWFLPRHA